MNIFLTSASPACYTIDSLSKNISTNRTIEDTVRSHFATSTSICHRPDAFYMSADNHSNQTRLVAYAEHITFEISRMHGDLPAEDICISNFEAIVKECAGHVSFAGGESHDRDMKYSLYLSSGFTEPENVHSLEARARGGSRVRPKARPRPKSKSKVKPKTKSKTKSKTKTKTRSKSKSRTKTKTKTKTKPNSKSKSKHKSKPNPRPLAKSTPTRKPTATQTKIKVGPTKNCKQLAMFMQKPSKAGKTIRDLGEIRKGFVGSRVAVEFREGLLKRVEENKGEEDKVNEAKGDEDKGDKNKAEKTEGDGDWDYPSEKDTQNNHDGTPKIGSACGATFMALKYPTSKSMVRNVFTEMKPAAYH